MKNKFFALIIILFFPLLFTSCIYETISIYALSENSISLKKTEDGPIWEKGTVTVTKNSDSTSIKITTSEGLPLSYTLIKTNLSDSFEEIETISAELPGYKFVDEQLTATPIKEATFTLPKNAKGQYYIAVEFYKSYYDDGNKIYLITDTDFTNIIKIK